MHICMWHIYMDMQTLSFNRGNNLISYIYHLRMSHLHLIPQFF